MNKAVDIEQVMVQATEACRHYEKISYAKRSEFLRSIAEEIEALGDALIAAANTETNLPEARLQGERTRTVNQLRAFATLVESGEWVQASIDTGDPERKPLPKPDLRKMLFPIGPVVVFGASNFPFAYSTAGGDTASALAAGCSVVVKSHPAHPHTSKQVASAIEKAIVKTNMPKHVFQHVEDGSIEVGQALIQHPLTKAGAFTGSLQGGRALFDLANRRKEPIPFFAEMGSINPVVLLPGSLKSNKNLASMLTASVTQGVGQFCTKPGLLIAISCEALDSFIQELSQKIGEVPAVKMLHAGIAKNFVHRKNESVQQVGVTSAAKVEEEGEGTGAPALAVTTSKTFLENPLLQEEVFGPYSLIVRCADKQELLQVVEKITGQLTTSLFCEPEDLNFYREVVEVLRQRCGRMVYNGVPTGVEVNKSMQHGGPYPASTDARYSSVGVDAVYRFLRPVSFQNFPEPLLPVVLQNQNANNLLRCINGEWTRESISLTNNQ